MNCAPADATTQATDATRKPPHEPPPPPPPEPTSHRLRLCRPWPAAARAPLSPPRWLKLPLTPPKPSLYSSHCDHPVFLNTLPSVGPCSPRAGYVSGEAHTNRGEQSTCMLFELCWRVSQHAPWRPLPSYPLRRRLLAASSSPPRRRLLAASSPPPRLTRMQAEIASAHVVHVQMVHVQDVHYYVCVRVMTGVVTCAWFVSRLCVFLPHEFKM